MASERMKESRGRPIEDFARVLQALGRRRDASAALVGGQAVNAWASVYLESLGASLERLLPFTSSDIDVAGSPDLLMALHRELGGELRIAGPRQIVHGTLFIGDGAQAVELDVLRVVGGVGAIRPSDTVPLELCGAIVPVLFPHLLLRGKLTNAMHLDQRGRQDVKHVKILVLVLGEFLRSLVRDVRPADERSVLTLLQEVLEILTSSDAQRFAKAHRVSFRDVMPARELGACATDRARFLPHRCFRSAGVMLRTLRSLLVARGAIGALVRGFEGGLGPRFGVTRRVSGSSV